MGYVDALHMRDLLLKPSCSCWNLRSLVNLQHLNKSPEETEVLQTVIFELRNFWKLLEIRGKPWNYFPWNSISINAALGHSKPIYVMIITVACYTVACLSPNLDSHLKIRWNCVKTYKNETKLCQAVKKNADQIFILCIFVNISVIMLKSVKVNVKVY